VKLKNRYKVFIPIIAVIILFVGVIIAISTKAGSFYVYAEDIKIIADEYEIAPELVAAVVKAESGFNRKAKSPKGAVGLMQLMPETAEYVAEMIDYNKPIDLYNAKCNLKLGTAYLRYLFDKYDCEKLAICAYNAGEGRVYSWLKNEEYSPDGQTLAIIPFGETKKYLESVLKYKSEFYQIYRGKSDSRK